MTFITDVRIGETDIIKRVENSPLTVRDFDGNTVVVIMPTSPWSHSKLMALVDSVNIIAGSAWDAWLGDTFVGSSEI